MTAVGMWKTSGFAASEDHLGAYIARNVANIECCLFHMDACRSSSRLNLGGSVEVDHVVTLLSDECVTENQTARKMGFDWKLQD